MKKNNQGAINETDSYKNEKPAIHFSCSGNMLVINPRFACHNSTLTGRTRVKEFSPSSGSRMRRFLRSCTAEYRFMLTLTYPHNYERDGAKSKEHLRQFIQQLRRESKQSGKFSVNEWGVFWFMEFQERGAIHYHLFTTERYSYKYVAQIWYRICGTEDIRHLQAGTRTEKIKTGRKGTISYASKYASKQEQKVIPDDIINAGRFWGVSGVRTVVAADTVVESRIQGDAAVKRRMNKIKEIVKDGIAQNKIERFKKSEGSCKVFIINDIKTMSLLWASMNLLTISVYQARLKVGNISMIAAYALPECEIFDKIGDEL